MIRAATDATLFSEPMVDCPDVSLMLAVKAGDDTAFAKLFARHQGTVHQLVRRFCNRDFSVDDAVQEVFLRVYQARHRYEPTSHFTAWLTTIARNVAFNGARGHWRERRRRAALLAHNQQHTEYAGPADLVAMETETRQLVLTAVDQLGERHRRVIQLYAIEGQSYQQIAQALNVSNAAVKSLLHRARAKLRDQLLRLDAPNDQAACCAS
ncbi:MAG: RNA polymerase subunit sigma-70 [Blastopirellula sp.]|nr:RNA polymerase subunit sigma-70 [Blastopirellula sp.]